jgi:hypothetical protein
MMIWTVMDCTCLDHGVMLSRSLKNRRYGIQSFNLKHALSTVRAWHVVVGIHRSQRHVAMFAVPRWHYSCESMVWYCTMTVKITVKCTKRKYTLAGQI